MQAKTTSITLARVLQLDIVLPALGFVVPLFVSGPQLFTGTAVNMLLVLFALRFPKKNAYAISVLPSLGAVSNGLLFGTFTPFLVYFLPFIWAGNYMLVHGVRVLQNKHPVVMLGASALGKSAFLFAVSFVLYRMSIVPVIFLTAMGAFQLATALAGGLVALGIRKATKQHV